MDNNIEIKINGVRLVLVDDTEHYGCECCPMYDFCENNNGGEHPVSLCSVLSGCSGKIFKSFPLNAIV